MEAEEVEVDRVVVRPRALGAVRGQEVVAGGRVGRG